jgi:hypothetical protein
MEGPVRVESGSVQTWRYSLPNVQGEGWAIIFLDETGCFAALSDWGDVSYRWNQRGLPEGGFKRFLIRCDDFYLISKFGSQRREYDPESTFESVKEHIIQARRDGTMEKDDAREEWDFLRTYEELRTEFDFWQWYSVTQLDAADFHCTRYVRDVVCFVKHVMPRLRELLKAELDPVPTAPVGAFMLGST